MIWEHPRLYADGGGNHFQMAYRPVVTEFLCEDCNDCGCICPDRAITVPFEKVTFYPAVEKQRANSPTLRRRLL